MKSRAALAFLFMASLLGQAAAFCPEKNCLKSKVSHSCCDLTRKKERGNCPGHQKKADHKAALCCGSQPVVLDSYLKAQPKSFIVLAVATAGEDVVKADLASSRTVVFRIQTGPPPITLESHLTRAPPQA
ncbi:MAG: hypothetical protein HY401_03830 [Elusimicrobia bacterium]|nr:hypothetical protein [Elusimicrobiota bacterium]